MAGGINPLPSIGPIVDGTSSRLMSPASILDTTIGLYLSTVGGTTTFLSTGNVLITTPLVAITAASTTMSGTLAVAGLATVGGALTVTGLVTGGSVTLQGHIHSVGGSAAPSTGTPSMPPP